MFNIFSQPRRLKTLEGAVATMVSQIQQALDKIDALEAKTEAERQQVEENIGALLAEIAGLKAEIGTGLDLRVVLDRLDTLGTHIEGIYTPPAEELPEVPTLVETLEPGFEVIDEPGDDPTGDALEPLPAEEMPDDDFPE